MIANNKEMKTWFHHKGMQGQDINWNSSVKKKRISLLSVGRGLFKAF